jgi:hypothetical protein
VLVVGLALTLLVAGAAAAQGEGPAGAGGPASTGETSETLTSTSSTTAPGSEAPAGVHGQVGEPASTTETPPTAQGGAGSGAPGAPEATATTPAPEVEAQNPQAASTPGAASGTSHHSHTHRGSGGTGAGTPGGRGRSSAKQPSGPSAPAPSALTPPLPGALGTPISGIPDFFIESFRIPPFLLPIYQAAGTAYDIPWQVLAAINEVETDYGRDLSVSSAGAEGWMQFLPSSWARYGVDANGDGYEDPYNPADAIFAAARYLQAAGGGTAAGGGPQHIRAAIFAYNHSQQYVESVMLRAQLLEGTPPELLSAITGLTESRFPVYAPAHFTDGFPATPGDPGRTLAGTVIYSQAGAPVIAVQDGEVTAVGDSPTLGRYVSLRDAYGNTYTYAQLGSVAALYPVLEPRVETAVSHRIAPAGSGLSLPKPSAPASAGVQPHSPLSEGAVSSSLALGAASALETPPPAPVAPAPVLAAPPAPATAPRVFRAGPDEVYLHPLVPGVQVLAGTVLGHLGTAGEGEGPQASAASGQSALAEAAEPHMLFQIRPAGAGAPLIDPKPILDGWVRLEETSVFRAKGENPFLATSPTVGQVLLASKPQLEQLLLRDPGVHLPHCERGAVRAGEVDRRVLAALEFLSVSGLSPTVSAAGCAHGASSAGAGNAIGAAAGDAVDISAVDGTPVAGHEGSDSITDIAVRRLLRLQGTMKPAQIVSAESYPGTDNTLTLPGYRGLIHVAFAGGRDSDLAVSSRTGARAAGVRLAGTLASPLTPSQWLQLVSQLGEIPEPVVTNKPSVAAIPDPGTTSPSLSSPSAGQSVPGAGTAGGGEGPSGEAGGG